MFRKIDQLAMEYPSLDLEDIQILLTIGEYPGYSIKEIADIINMSEKAVQLRISLMSNGRKGRSSSSLQLITVEYKISDGRARLLTLTEKGNIVADQLKFLTKKGY